MEKCIPKQYMSDFGPVKVAMSFIYEVVIESIMSDRFELLGTKYYSSSKLLKLNTDYKLYKLKDRFLSKSITLVGVPEKYINDNNLEEAKRLEKVKRKTKKQNV